MATATILPPARTVFLDTNNNPLSGGFVYMYVPPATSTPKTTWQDAGETIPNSNPIVLDANGSCLLYGAGQYLQMVYDSANNLIYSGLTQDVYGLLTGSNNVWTGTNTFNGTINFGNINGIVGNSNGGFINKFRNADFEVAQRGTSGTVTAGNTAYTLDGWQMSVVGANVSWGQGGSIITSNAVSTKSLFFTTAASISTLTIQERIEGSIAKTLAGFTVTVQWAVTQNTGSTITPNFSLVQATVVDNWASQTTLISSTPLQSIPNNTPTIVAYTFSCPSTVGLGISPIIDFSAAAALNPGSTISISLADIRVTPGISTGLNSSPPVPEQRPIAIELSYCQRYYETITGGLLAQVGYGAGAGAGYGGQVIYYKNTKRAVASVALTAASSVNTSTIVLNSNQVEGFNVSATVTGTGSAAYSFNFPITASAEL